MIKQLALFLFFIQVSFIQISFANERMAPYILDGSLVVYSPSIPQVISIWSTMQRQSKGVEYDNITNRLTLRISDKLSANPFTPEGASALGIDYMGGVAYVQLRQNIGYMVFTVSNESILRSRLDTLEDPVPYRLEGGFVIFSASEEILDYYNFRGVTVLDEYNKIARELNLNWDKPFFWLDSSFFEVDGIRSMGERLMGTFNFIDNKLIIDAFTSYNDPEVNQLIRDSRDVNFVQRMTLLDFESGKPPIAGNLYVNFASLLKMSQAIDKANFLSMNRVFSTLKKRQIDIESLILPYLQGRLSYVIRAFKPAQNEFDFTMSVGINNKAVLQQNLRDIVQQTQSAGINITYKYLFTQQFYGWTINDMTLWVGIVEDHLVISVSEKSLNTFVENVYQDNNGFLNKLPVTMQRSIQNRAIGGQAFINQSELLQNIEVFDWFIPREIMLALNSIKWDFYLVDNENIIGRRDVWTLEFNNE